MKNLRELKAESAEHCETPAFLFYNKKPKAAKNLKNSKRNPQNLLKTLHVFVIAQKRKLQKTFGIQSGLRGIYKRNLRLFIAKDR